MEFIRNIIAYDLYLSSDHGCVRLKYDVNIYQNNNLRTNEL